MKTIDDVLQALETLVAVYQEYKNQEEVSKQPVIEKTIEVVVEKTVEEEVVARPQLSPYETFDAELKVFDELIQKTKLQGVADLCNCVGMKVQHVYTTDDTHPMPYIRKYQFQVSLINDEDAIVAKGTLNARVLSTFCRCFLQFFGINDWNKLTGIPKAITLSNGK